MDLYSEAKTAAQKLEMRGEAATIDNIKRFVSETIAKEELESEKKTFGDYVLSAIKIVLKFVFIIFGDVSVLFCWFFCLLYCLCYWRRPEAQSGLLRKA